MNMVSPIDPSELETKLSTEAATEWLEFLVDDEPSDGHYERVEKIRQVMDDLPRTEADYLELYHFLGFKQTDIARLFGVSQPTVHYRLQRAQQRILFLLSLPNISEEQIRKELSKYVDDEFNVNIMVLMFRTTCQSEVASMLDVSQGLVRYRFINTLEKIKNISELNSLYNVYQSIADNLTILRDVRSHSRTENYKYVIV